MFKKIKELWKQIRENSVVRKLKQVLYAFICILLGSLIPFEIILILFGCIVAPTLLVGLGYYLGTKSKKQDKKSDENKK